jgi:hypothetical protein
MRGLFLLLVPILAGASSVDLLASKDKSFCERILQSVQKNTGSGPGLHLEAEPFIGVTWEPVVIAGMAPRMRRCSSLDKALVDLDNDGTKDLVVKTSFCMKGAPSDSFYVFPADSRVLEQVSWQDLAPLLATPDKFERTGGSYPLTGLPPEPGRDKDRPSLSTVFTLQPFLLEGRTYIALTDGRGEWTVIAQYLRGERFEDLCYLKSPGASIPGNLR